MVVVIPRNLVCLMLPTQIYKATEDEARIKIYFDNWDQPGTLRRSKPGSSLSTEEWDRLTEIDPAPVVRKVAISGSDENNKQLATVHGHGVIGIRGVWFSPHDNSHYRDLHD